MIGKAKKDNYIFKFEIETENAAFKYGAAGEIRRILDDVVDRVGEVVENGRSDSGKLIDTNGNSVGTWAVEAD